MLHNKKHWLWNTRFYRTRHNIQWRCNRNWPRYHRYKWRWIKCLRKTFEEFRDDMYASYLEHVEKYWENNTSIDRIENDWNYCKENCKRSTRKEQSKTNSKTHYIVYNNKKYNLLELSIETWIHISTLKHRVYRWLNINDIVSKVRLNKNNSVIDYYKKHCDIFKDNHVSYIVFYKRIRCNWWSTERAINTPKNLSPNFKFRNEN